MAKYNPTGANYYSAKDRDGYKVYREAPDGTVERFDGLNYGDPSEANQSAATYQSHEDYGSVSEARESAEYRTREVKKEIARQRSLMPPPSRYESDY